MPNSLTPFFAARLVDQEYKTEVPYFPVDTSSHESLLESIEAITKSSQTPDAVKGMLGVVKTKAAEMLTEEERATLFKDAGESDGIPYTVEVTAENRGLVYEALDQLAVSAPKPEPGADNTDVTADIERLKAEAASLSEELERVQCVDEAVVPYQNLPLADEDTAWDEGEARKKLREWAKSGEDVDWNKYRKGFLWYDESDPEKTSAYKFPIATVEGSGLNAVPHAIYNSAARVDQASVPASDKSGIRSHLAKYYKRLGKEIPWKKEDSTEDPDLKAQELNEKITALEADNRAKDETINALRAEAAKYEALKHDNLVKEAARLAAAAGRAIAKDRSFDELCELLSARSDESLTDTIEDLKVESAGSGDPAGGEPPAGTPPADPPAAPTVEHVEDPRLPGTAPEGGVSQPDLGSLTDQMRNSVSEDKSQIEIYKLVLGPKAAGEILGED